MEDLLEDFVAETRDALDAIGDELVAWEADPSDRARLDAVFRFLHTVKGSAGLLDLPRLARLCHAGEDVLAGVRAGRRLVDRAAVDAVLAVIDRLRELLHAVETGTGLPADADEALLAALGAGRAVPPQPPRAPQRRAPARSVRVPVTLLDRIGAELAAVQRACDDLAGRVDPYDGDADADGAACRRIARALDTLRETLAATRLGRAEHLFAPLPRMVRDLAAELGREVALTIAGGEIAIDRETIAMIRDPLMHLVRNAIDHGIEPPDARAAGGKPRAGRLAVSACDDGDAVLIAIEDDGRGVDGEALVRRAVAAGIVAREDAAALGEAARLELMFAPGLSTAPAVTSISGRGVGMDVARTNLARVGGTIAVDNRPGAGLRLCLRVPVARATIVPPPAGEAHPRSGRTCLVVDDSRMIRTVLRRLLETLGFDVAEASDGRVALDQLALDAPDVVLLDCNMPVMDGLAFLAALPARGVAPRPKVLFCTTESGAGEVRAALALGADAYLAKPFDRAALADALAGVGLG